MLDFYSFLILNHFNFESFLSHLIQVYIFVYMVYKVSHIYLFIYLFLLYSTVMFFLHCMLNILRYENMFCEIDDMTAS